MNLKFNESCLYFLFAVLFSVGLFLHFWTPETREWARITTPYFLGTVYSLALLLSFQRTSAWIFFFRVIFGLYLLTAVIEVIGVKSGFPFGHYEYSAALGPKVLGVPILIGFLWVGMIFGSFYFASILSARFFKESARVFVAPVLTALFILLQDLLLEPFATAQGLWTWDHEWHQGLTDFFVAPLNNYLSWSVIAFFASFFLQPFPREVFKSFAILIVFQSVFISILLFAF